MRGERGEVQTALFPAPCHVCRSTSASSAVTQRLQRGPAPRTRLQTHPSPTRSHPPALCLVPACGWALGEGVGASFLAPQPSFPYSCLSVIPPGSGSGPEHSPPFGFYLTHSCRLLWESLWGSPRHPDPAALHRLCYRAASGINGAPLGCLLRLVGPQDRVAAHKAEAILGDDKVPVAEVAFPASGVQKLFIERRFGGRSKSKLH